MKPLEITLQSDEESLVELSLAGFLDAHTVSSFERELDEYLEKDKYRIILDIGELTYISSAGIGAMMGLAQRLRKNSGVLVLLKPSEKVFKILDTLGFTKIFQITNDVEEAKKAVAAAG